MEFSKSLESHKTPIEGLYVYDLTVHGDARGWFKENWQKEKMTDQSVALPDFGPVQNNISFNAEKGVTRGLHAEPWDKYISTGSGSVFGAWCDIREDSPTYGQTFTVKIDPSVAVYVPRGVANGFQALEDGTVYTYLVNDHWSPDAQYSNVSIYDDSLNIDWPIPLSEATVSDKDKAHPNLSEATPIKPKKILVTGADGQLGRALRDTYPEAEFVNRHELDITSDNLTSSRRWRDYGVIINAAAYTAVDQAETEQGRKDAWSVNAKAVANLAKIATQNNILLVHVSSDYVFDGTQENHTEDEPLSPLGVYGQSKAAGDIAAATTPRHYILRTSWVIGEGENFVRTMMGLAEKNISPTVVADQIGRLTFTSELVRIIDHFLTTGAPYGTYNATNDGPLESWADITRRIFSLAGRDDLTVTDTTTAEYFAGKDGVAPRPLNSGMNLEKLHATGFTSRDWTDDLKECIKITQ